MISKKVIAIYSNCLYIEELLRYSGIKVAPTEIPGDLEIGDFVDIGGIMRTENNERYIGGAVVAF